MGADIIQFIPRRKRDDAQTCLPTIAFRIALRELSIDRADAVSEQHGGPASRDA